MLLLVVVSLNSFFSCDNFCTDDSLRWFGILSLSTSAKLAAAARNASSRVKIGFVMYFCMKNTVPDALGVCVSLNHRLQHR